MFVKVNNSWKIAHKLVSELGIIFSSSDSKPIVLSLYYNWLYWNFNKHFFKAELIL